MTTDRTGSRPAWPAAAADPPTKVDVSDREAQLAELKRLAAIVESSYDAIIGYTPDAIITTWNSGAQHTLGYPASEILGQSLASLLRPNKPEDWQHLLAACRNPHGVTAFETCWLHRNGEPRSIELTCSPITDAKGKMLYGSAIARDISERRRAERALRHSEQRLAGILEQTAMGLAQTDLDGRFQLVNPRYCAIMGRTARELYRMRVQDIIHPDDVGTVEAVFEGLRDGAPQQQIERRCVRPDGRVVWVSSSVTVMRDRHGQPQHALAAVLDITEQKRASQHVELMLDELNHRVKNTLATVQAIAQQTLAGSSSLTAFRTAFNARLLALSKTHNLLANDAWIGASLRDIVAGELAPYLQVSHGPARVHIRGENLQLSPKIALALSMTIHELATNASKYGALSGPQGEVTVRWQRCEAPVGDGPCVPWLKLLWSEAGGPEVLPPVRRGFGTRLITDGVAFELNGDAVLHYEKTGVRCVIQVPLSEDAT